MTLLISLKNGQAFTLKQKNQNLRMIRMLYDNDVTEAVLIYFVILSLNS